jgi:type II secretory pathway pseudopilin PulG
MPCFRSNGRSAAFTLIEVIAGLTLMATVLVGSLLSFAAHQKQRRFADAKIAAVTIADDLLHVMSNSPDGIPATGRGRIPGQRNWFWQTSVVGAMAPAQTPIRVIRFEIMEQSSPGQIRALVTVDLFQPMDAG